MAKRYNENTVKYFKEREEAKLNQQLKDSKKVETELIKAYQRASEEITKEINNLFTKYAKDNQLTYSEASKLLTNKEYKAWKMTLKEYIEDITNNGNIEALRELNTLSMKSRITRLEEMLSQVDKQLINLYSEIEKQTEQLLIKSVKDNYYQSIYEVQKFTGKADPFAILDDKLIRTIIEYPWANGFNYSSTIWKNKDLATITFKREITDMIIQGKGNREVAKNISEKLGSDLKHAMRVVNTEHSYICSEASAKAYKELDVEQYEVLATLDEVTCPICSGHDGEVANLKDRKVGLNAAPFHPSCRCTEVPYIPDDYGTRIARDNNGKNTYVPSNMKYDEWYSKFVEAKM